MKTGIEPFKFVSGDKVLASGKVRIVKYFDDDICGDGCCQGYVLEGELDTLYLTSDLKLIIEE